jgi:hypothetical protein
MEIALVVAFIVAIIAGPFATLYAVSAFRRRRGGGEKPAAYKPYDGPDDSSGF